MYLPTQELSLFKPKSSVLVKQFDCLKRPFSTVQARLFVDWDSCFPKTYYDLNRIRLCKHKSGNKTPEDPYCWSISSVYCTIQSYIHRVSSLTSRKFPPMVLGIIPKEHFTKAAKPLIEAWENETGCACSSSHPAP